MENTKAILAGVLALAIIAGGIIWVTSDSDDSSDTSSTESSQTTEQTQTETRETTPAPTPNIVGLAQSNTDLSVLVSAVVEADLVDTLSGPGPFTVFAPTDQAFTNLLTELDITAAELLARDDLAAILTYHVVPGKVMSSDLSDGQVVTTVQGGTLTVGVGSDGVTLTDANGNVSTVAAADVEASNGVVHVIDTVVLP